MARPVDDVAALHKALAQRAERELALALKVAHALERGMRREEIAARLDVSRGEVLDATRRVERARGNSVGDKRPSR
jgi:transposase